jgi:hypothetical protein
MNSKYFVLHTGLTSVDQIRIEIADMRVSWRFLAVEIETEENRSQWIILCQSPEIKIKTSRTGNQSLTMVFLFQNYFSRLWIDRNEKELEW